MRDYSCHTVNFMINAFEKKNVIFPFKFTLKGGTKLPQRFGVNLPIFYSVCSLMGVFSDCEVFYVQLY